MCAGLDWLMTNSSHKAIKKPATDAIFPYIVQIVGVLMTTYRIQEARRQAGRGDLQQKEVQYLQLATKTVCAMQAAVTALAGPC